jgi:hypothetical protein
MAEELASCGHCGATASIVKSTATSFFSVPEMPRQWVAVMLVSRGAGHSSYDQFGLLCTQCAMEVTAFCGVLNRPPPGN